MPPADQGPGPDSVAVALQERAERLRRDAMDEFGPAPVLDPVDVTPPPWHDDHEHPATVTDQLDQLGGIASAILVEDGRTLLVKKGWVDQWDNPGGALEPGESLAETAEREIEEETNLDVELVDLLYTRDLRFDYGGPERIAVPVASFLAKPLGGSLAVPWHYVPDGSPEITELVWFGPDELPEDIRDRALMQDILRGDDDSPSTAIDELV